jgi:hypothetical protein
MIGARCDVSPPPEEVILYMKKKYQNGKSKGNGQCALFHLKKVCIFMGNLGYSGKFYAEGGTKIDLEVFGTL